MGGGILEVGWEEEEEEVGISHEGVVKFLLLGRRRPSGWDSRRGWRGTPSEMGCTADCRDDCHWWRMGQVVLADGQPMPKYWVYSEWRVVGFLIVGIAASRLGRRAC